VLMPLGRSYHAARDDEDLYRRLTCVSQPALLGTTILLGPV
jgi:hypothetical protein